MLIQALVAIYVLGFLVAIAVWRDPWPVRVGTAAAWPLGVVSLAMVTVTLVAASFYLWPVLLVPALALAAAIWLAF